MDVIRERLRDFAGAFERDGATSRARKPWRIVTGSPKVVKTPDSDPRVATDLARAKWALIATAVNTLLWRPKGRTKNTHPRLSQIHRQPNTGIKVGFCPPKPIPGPGGGQP